MSGISPSSSRRQRKALYNAHTAKRRRIGRKRRVLLAWTASQRSDRARNLLSARCIMVLLLIES